MIKKYIPNRYKRVVVLLTNNILQSIFYYVKDSHFFDKRIANRLTTIIFVCKGNVCRSAFAEIRLTNLLQDDNVKVDSCGLNVDQGNYPPPDSIAVSSEYSCFLSNRKAKALIECDIAGADLILAMEYGQYRQLINLYPQKQSAIKLLRSFAPLPYSLFCNIADPYGWGRDEFRKSFRLIDRALQKLVRLSSSPH